MRILASLLVPALAACASAPPADCGYPELSRTQVLTLVKDQIEASGGNPSIVGNGNTVPRVAPDGCGYVVRLTFPPPRTGDWAAYTVMRDGSVKRVFTGN